MPRKAHLILNIFDGKYIGATDSHVRASMPRLSRRYAATHADVDVTAMRERAPMMRAARMPCRYLIFIR